MWLAASLNHNRGPDCRNQNAVATLAAEQRQDGHKIFKAANGGAYEDAHHHRDRPPPTVLAEEEPCYETAQHHDLALGEVKKARLR
jgi:hypothetical protein